MRVSKKRLLLIISVLLLTICALGFMVYKLVYKNWYNKNSLKIVYYEKLNKYKTGSISDSVYLFVMKKSSGEAETTGNDYIVNEKGQIVYLQGKDFFETKIGVNGRYIEMINYDSNETNKDDVYIYNSNLELKESYQKIIPGSLNEIMTGNEVAVGEHNGKLVYFYNKALYTYNTQSQRKEVLKDFKEYSIVSCRQSCSNPSICIIKYYNGDYRFYNISNDTFSQIYNLINVETYWSAQEYMGYSGDQVYDILINPNLDHYYINKIKESTDSKNDEFTYNVLDTVGNTVIDDEFKDCNQFYRGCAKITDKNGDSYFIDINNSRISAPKDTEQYTVQCKLTDNVFFAQNKVYSETEKGQMVLWYLIDKNGNILRSLNEDEKIYDFVNGYSFIYNSKNKNGYIINEKGEVTVDMWRDVYSKYPNIKKLNDHTARDSVNNINIYLPRIGLSDSGLFYDVVLDDKGNIIQVVFNNKGEIQFACSAEHINTVVKIEK